MCPSRRCKVDLTDHDELRLAQACGRGHSECRAAPAFRHGWHRFLADSDAGAPCVRAPGQSPGGIGLDSQAVRARMVQKLAAQGIADAQVLTRDGHRGAASFRRQRAGEPGL